MTRMRRHLMNTCWLGAAALLLGGCYEETGTAPQQPQTQPAPADAEAPAPPATGSGGMDSQARPSLSGSKRAAQNTVDRIGERQQELEKALEDDE
jgi:hypothetical protein